MSRRPPISTRTDTLFPYTTLFRSVKKGGFRPDSRVFASVEKALHGAGASSSVRPRRAAEPPRRHYYTLCRAPVAQLDRASDYGSEGWEFESSRARHNPLKIKKSTVF